MVAKTAFHPHVHRYTAPRRGFHLLEALESRTLLSATLFVTPAVPPDATHFQTLQGALTMAARGDTIVLQSGFSPGTFVTTALTQAAAAGATFLHTAAALDVGDVISIGNNIGGDTLERNLITAVTEQGPNDYLIALASPLLAAHSGSVVDANNGTLGPAIGLAQGITLTADSGVVLPFNLEIWQGGASSQTTLANLNMGAYSLLIDGNGSTINNCTLGRVVVQAGATGNAFVHNTFNIATGDGFSLERADGTLLDSNTFHVTSSSAFAILVHNSANVLITNNFIQTGSGATAIYVSADGTGSTSADIRNNILQTTDGFGLVLAKSDTTASLEARVQGNDLRANAIGVYVIGDGISAGNIDLGGGSTVFGASTGGNDFSGFNLTDAGHFAIGLFGTGGACYIHANANKFSPSNPLNVVADSQHTPAANGSGLILATGTSVLEYLMASPATLAVKAGVTTGTLASFTSNLSHLPADFIAVIDWGDGSDSPGVIADNGAGGFVVTGTHTWSDAGTYQVAVIIESNTGGSVVAADTAVVPPLAPPRVITLDGGNVTSDKCKTFSGVVATFNDSKPGTAAADYLVSITWSDGITSAARISKNPDGSFAITTSRAFSKAGVFVANITLNTVDGFYSGTAAFNATITNVCDKLPPGRLCHFFQFIKLICIKRPPPCPVLLPHQCRR